MRFPTSTRPYTSTPFLHEDSSPTLPPAPLAKSPKNSRDAKDEAVGMRCFSILPNKVGRVIP